MGTPRNSFGYQYIMPNKQMDIDKGFEHKLSNIATGRTRNDEGSDEDSDGSGEDNKGLRDRDEGDDESETKPKQKYCKQNCVRRNGALLFIVRNTLC